MIDSLRRFPHKSKHSVGTRVIELQSCLLDLDTRSDTKFLKPTISSKKYYFRETNRTLRIKSATPHHEALSEHYVRVEGWFQLHLPCIIIISLH